MPVNDVVGFTGGVFSLCVSKLRGWIYGGSSQQNACVSVKDVVGFTGGVLTRDAIVSVNDVVGFTEGGGFSAECLCLSK